MIVAAVCSIVVFSLRHGQYEAVPGGGIGSIAYTGRFSILGASLHIAACPTPLRERAHACSADRKRLSSRLEGEMLRRSVFVVGCLVAGSLAVYACGSSSDDTAGASDASAADGAGTGADASQNDGGVSASDGAGSLDGGGVDACGPSFCALAPGACGAAQDGCGTVQTCGLCRYAAEPIGTSTASHRPVSLVVGASVDVAYPGGFAVRTAPSAWTVNAGPSATSVSMLSFIHAAVAADGTAWVAFPDTDYTLAVAHGVPGADAGAWTKESAVKRAVGDADIAIGSDGVPVVAFAGYAASGTSGAVSIARRVGSTWTEVPVGTSTKAMSNVSLAMNGTTASVAWSDPATSAVMFAQATSATTFATEMVDATGGSVTLALDATGNPHVAYGSATYSTRVNGGWTKQSVAAPSFFDQYSQAGPPKIAVSPSGAVAIAAMGDTLWVAQRAGGTWFSQTIVPDCNSTDSGFDMAFDATSTLHVAHSCRSDESFLYLTEQGSFPPDYAATCLQVATAACNAAGKCPLDQTGKPCVDKNGSSACINAPFCPGYIANGMCGDATQDGGAIYACSGAIAGAKCEPDGGQGLELPAVCPPPP
jgi:hypothetical protein